MLECGDLDAIARLRRHNGEQLDDVGAWCALDGCFDPWTHQSDAHTCEVCHDRWTSCGCDRGLPLLVAHPPPSLAPPSSPRARCPLCRVGPARVLVDPGVVLAGECCVCLQECERKALFADCGHAATCVACARRLAELA